MGTVSGEVSGPALALHCTHGGSTEQDIPTVVGMKGADKQRWREQHTGPGAALWAQARARQPAA